MSSFHNFIEIAFYSFVYFLVYIKVLFNELNDYFKHNIRMSLVFRKILIIITKEDLFYCININNKNIPSFIYTIISLFCV